MKARSPKRSRRPRGCKLLTTSAALAALAASSAGLAAQSPVGHRVVVGGDRPAGVTAISPRSAAPGATVTLRAALLPPHAPVQVMVGALRSGFEVVLQGVTDGEGRLAGADSIPLEVPSWLERDRSYLVIVTDLYYRPLAVTDVFHPTDENGHLTRSGHIMREAEPCPALTNSAGELYFLSGVASEAFQPGEEVVVEGRVLEGAAPCGQGTTLEVTRLRRPGTP